MSVPSRCDSCDSHDGLSDYCLGNCHHRSDFKDAEGKAAEAKERHLVADQLCRHHHSAPEQGKANPAQMSTFLLTSADLWKGPHPGA